MRIAYLVSRFPHLPESFVLREIDRLEQEGIEVVLCPLLRNDEPVSHPAAARWVERAWYTPFVSRRLLQDAGAMALSRPRPLSRAYGKALARVATTPNFVAGTLGISLKVPHLARRLEAAGVDHVHAHFATHPAMAAWLVHRLTGIGYSFTAHAHDIYVHTAMIREKIAEARFVVTVSEFNRRLLSSFGDPAKLHVVHCGVDLRRYPFRSREPRDPVEILSVASLQPYKGLEYLIRACRVLVDRVEPRFRLHIVGDGELRGRLEQLVKQLGLQAHVALLGPQTEERVGELLQEADVFVLPSVVTPSGKMEGLPVVLMEALAVGVPAISTAISGIPEIVRPDETGLLVPPADPDALAAAMMEVMQDPEAARARAVRGRALVEAEFALDANVQRLAALFRAELAA